ncbi:MAG TPA: Maf family protein [Candidatus Paceibacterota bacterium]|nr:Maf family protein [Candidatus Paceibacterota bacterium]
MKIILGSSSPWRAEIMRSIVPEFEVMDPGIDEKNIRHPNPQVLTAKLARAKSEALRPRITGDALLITADQVVTCIGEIREKPHDAAEARRWLRSYREQPVICVNALVSFNTVNKHDALFLDQTRVWLRGLTDRTIEHIIEHTVAMQCAGACAAGHPEWGAYVAKIDGDVSGLYGLPRELTRTIIENETQR